MVPVRLPDGRGVTIRSIHGSDKPLLAGLFDRLSAESRHRRFFAGIESLSPSMLRYFTDLDHHDHEALVALDDAGLMVGVARFVRHPHHPTDAEVAVTVVDDWQGGGLGTALVALLCDRARAEDVTRFTGDTLWSNRPMHELLRELGAPEFDPRDGVDAFSLLLPAEPLADRLPELLDHAVARRRPSPCDPSGGP